MADPTDDRTKRLDRLEEHIRANSSQLTKDGGITGTDLNMGMLDMLRFKGEFDAFKEKCARLLTTSPTCATMFNIMGRQVNVEVSMPQAQAPGSDKAEITITNPRVNAVRRVSFNPGDSN